MLFDDILMQKAETLLAQCRARSWRVSAAESCTGGLLAALLTEIPGSSAVIGRSFITYSNRAKHEILGVPVEVLQSEGAVSEAVVRAMAEGVLERTTAHLTIGISGVAGPGGGTPEKPAGFVCMATATEGGTMHATRRFGDIGRTAVRLATIDNALDMMLARLQETVQ